MHRHKRHTFNFPDGKCTFHLDSLNIDKFHCIAAGFNNRIGQTILTLIHHQTDCLTLADLKDYAEEKQVSMQRLFEVALERYPLAGET